MAYTFDQIFAADPSNPGNVAANGVVTIFAPGDASQAPLAIMDTAGNPLANPVTVNANGYGDAFSHATLDRVAWAGGGFSGFFTSYEGLKDEAVAARAAAEEALGGVPGRVTQEVAAVAATGAFKGDPGQDGSNVVPTAEAIAAEIETPGTLANTALSATIADAIEPKLDESAADVKYAQISALIKGSQTVIIGDSVDADVKGWYTYYAIQSGKIKTLRNSGIGGNTTSQMLARLQTDALTYKPDIVILGASTNDQGQGVAESLTRSNITAMVDATIASGATPVLRTTPPVDNAGTTGQFNTVPLRRQAVLRHNTWLRGFAAKRGIEVLDVYQAVADPLTGGYKAGITTDGIHPTEAGSKAIADYLLSLGVPPIFKGGHSFARAVTDEGNMLKNGVFLGDADGNGLSDNWLIVSGTPTSALTAAATGITGNWQRITTTSTASAALAQDVQATDNGRVVYDIGDTIEYAGRVRTSGTATAIVRVAMWSAATSPADPLASTTLPIADGVFSGRATIPTGTTKIRLLVQTSGASGWIEVAECAIRNLTKLGLN